MYTTLLVLLPLGALVLFTVRMSPAEFWSATLGDPRVVAACRVSLGASLLAALANVVFGSIVAWVLVRYRFPGRRLLDALVDLPFAMPTAVSGIALTTLYAQSGWIGRWLDLAGIRVAYAYPGIVLALTLVGFPFIVRTLQPALEGLEEEVEEAAASLGATRAQVLRRVIFPSVLPAMLTGFTLAFARAVGEFGSVYFIAGNLPFRTEIAPLLILIRLEQYDYPGATAIGVLMLAVSFVLLFLINVLQSWSRRFLD